MKRSTAPPSTTPPSNGRLPAATDSEARFRSALDAFQDSLLTYAPVRDGSGQIVDFTYTYLNAAAASTLGRPADELVGGTLLDNYPTASESGVFTACVRALTVMRPESIHAYDAREDGVQGHWEVSVYPFGDEILVMARDITEKVSTETALQRSEERHRLLAENASDIVTLVALDGTIDWVSPSVRTVLGWDPDDLVGTRPWNIVHPDDRPAAAVSLAEAARSETDPRQMTVRFQAADGRYVWMASSANQMADGHFVISFRLVDDQVRAERALADSEERYRLMVENAMDLVFSLDTHAILQWLSPSITPLLGYDADELVGLSGAVLVKPEDLPLLLDAATEARNGKPSSARIRLVTKSGADRWVEAVPRTIYDKDRTLVGGVIGVRDIHEEVVTRRALEHEIDFDSLTGLAKRSVALDRIQEILDTRSVDGWALLCAGVDGLTAVNQAYTYAAGDEVLRAVAQRLVESAGAPDRVARIAGDEFVILMRDIVSPADAANAAERLLAAIRGPVQVGDVTIDVTASIGIALSSLDDAEGLVRDASAAMRQAGRKGSDSWELLDGNVGADTRQVLAVQAGLREALFDGRIQPWIMPLATLADGVVLGYEALARWIHRDGTISTPDAFLDAAEHSSLILGIDRTILSQSLDHLPALPAGTSIAVNVSAATLSSGSLVEDITAELDRTGADPSRLHLEVTETALFEVTGAVQRTMRDLADLGISWWVDDFGTGFSSISHLRDLPISGVKLDRSFTAAVTATDSHASRLSRGLAGLAKGLGLLTIAEGVETPMQAQVLADHGWLTGQGWLFGRPEPIARNNEGSPPCH